MPTEIETVERSKTRRQQASDPFWTGKKNESQNADFGPAEVMPEPRQRFSQSSPAYHGPLKGLVDESKEFEKLREVHEQNQADKAWLKSISARAEALERQCRATEEELRANPTDQTVKDFVVAQARCNTEKKHWNQARIYAGDTISRRIEDRTRPVLEKALQKLRKQIGNRRADFLGKATASYREIGVPFEEVTNSTPARAYDSAEESIAKYLRELAKMDATTLNARMEWVLSMR